MGFNGLDDCGGKGQVFLFRLPVLVKQGRGFVCGIEHQALGQQRLGGKVGQFVGGEFVEAPGAADTQGGAGRDRLATRFSGACRRCRFSALPLCAALHDSSIVN